MICRINSSPLYQRFLFEELFYRDRASRFAHARKFIPPSFVTTSHYATGYHRNQHSHHNQGPPETEQEYAARLRRAREEQERAAERRAQEEAARKADQEREREQGKLAEPFFWPGLPICHSARREAEQRKRNKTSAKKAAAEASRKTAEEKVRSQREQAQAKRSKIFAAARRNDAAAVQKGVWEEEVDAAGGEIRKGAEDLVEVPPADPKETLTHIAAGHGNLDLVQWLDSHSTFPVL